MLYPPKENHHAEHIATLEGELRELRAWKEGVEEFMGQRGIESLNAMLAICTAAREWYEAHFSQYPECPVSVDKALHDSNMAHAVTALWIAVQDYESLVYNREQAKKEKNNG